MFAETLVMTHRDPVDVVDSACSLLKVVRPMFSDEVDVRAIGDMLLDTFDTMIARTIAYKATHGGDSIYDLHYADVIRDPIGEIKKIYAHFDEPFTAVAEAAMRNYITDNPQGKHGKHSYALKDYGLTPVLHTRPSLSAHPARSSASNICNIRSLTAGF